LQYSVSPFYNKPTQEGIYQHFKAISQASPIPIIIYNVPEELQVICCRKQYCVWQMIFKILLLLKKQLGYGSSYANSEESQKIFL
jgi:hypothetical protein